MCVFAEDDPRKQRLNEKCPSVRERAQTVCVCVFLRLHACFHSICINYAAVVLMCVPSVCFYMFTYMSVCVSVCVSMSHVLASACVCVCLRLPSTTRPPQWPSPPGGLAS